MAHTNVRHPVSASRGFTLIELLVVTSILIFVTGVVLANHSGFGGKILLENLGYDVALSIRQAQVYGISVRQYGGSNFNLGYGVRFILTSPTSYSLFGDADRDGLWDSGEDVSPSPYTIERGYFIEKLCVPAGESVTSCVSTNQVDIIFKRPEPDACISKGGVSAISGNYVCSAPEESARIVLKSPRGDRTSVIVEATGQISVQ